MTRGRRLGIDWYVFAVTAGVLLLLSSAWIYERVLDLVYLPRPYPSE